jgi:hypothetical protein
MEMAKNEERRTNGKPVLAELETIMLFQGLGNI